ncbi:MAG: aspartyl/asparaginyl beta-hydroxylase domain-containing protein [Bacteroidia bacterium]|jgi:quercetin dioxygenase-like cupin family protein|nr:aspartyl/asparaginyl beta-hydroxylase domain-containing protein [Bacteroidia bacterium]
MTTSLLLPLQWNVLWLQNDLRKAFEAEWGNHYNTKDYSGNWSSISLYSASGRSNDVLALPAEKFHPTPLLDQCAYFKQVLDELKFEKETVRLLCLRAGSQVHPHRDPGLAYRFGLFRLHVPVVTTQEVEFEVAGQLLDMQPGSCWYADFDAVHSVRNFGQTDRVHLVIDGKPNAWTDELFARAGYNFEAAKEEEKMDEATLQNVIAELKRQNNPAADALIAQLNATHRS